MESSQSINQLPPLPPPPPIQSHELSGTTLELSVAQDASEWLPSSSQQPSLEPAASSNASPPPAPFTQSAIPWATTSTIPNPPSSIFTDQQMAPSTPSTLTPGPPSPGGGGGMRPLNVKDALSYLEMVKVRFQDKPDVYNHFLDIMKDFKSQAIDTPGVIERVSTLFTGHPSLIQGFNTFLPAGYRIECSSDGQETNLITVTTPTGTTTSTHSGGIGSLSRVASGTANLPLPSVFGASSSSAVLSSSGFSGFGTTGSFDAPGGSSTPLGPLPPPLSPASVHPSTPSGAAILGGLGQQQNPKGPPVPAPEFNHAIQYVNKIKNRFADDPDTYKQFLEILQTYQKEQRPIQDVYAQVTILFKNAHDLLEEFKQFLPDTSGNLPSGGLFNMIAAATPSSSSAMAMEIDAKDKAKKTMGGAVSTSGAADKAQKRKRKVLDKELVAMAKAGQAKAKKPKHHHNPKQFLSPPPFQPETNQTPPRPLPPSTALHHPSTSTNHVATNANRHHGHHNYPPEIPDLPDEAAFFDRVKRMLDDRVTYHEFLKLLNLFVQEIIDIQTLVEKARSFLGDNPLYTQFKDILGWDDRHLREVEGGARGVIGVVGALEREKVDLNACRRYGPSYRKLPKNEVTLACSGRDAMCWEVLNDEWISHPQWAAEETGFSTHKKNAYEDALHKSEEERHEYDFHIEAITRTIQVLEPIAARINMMDTDERATFKLKPGLGGQGKSIYQRILKKVYGRDHGLEVIQALHESPAIAVPVVLARLKQKEEEWKRAQREWNKVWREIDSKNFYKSLDHQGGMFKANDKKLITPKQLIADIENKVKEQQKDRRELVDPTYGRFIPKWQYSFKVEDWRTLQDALKLIFSFLDRSSNSQISRVEKDRSESFLRNFVPLFFIVDPIEFEGGLLPSVSPMLGADDLESDDVGDEVGSVADDVDDSVSVAGSTATAPSTSRRGGGRKPVGVPAVDLRKKLLKNAQERGRKARNGKDRDTSTAPPSRASPAPASDQMQIDSEPNSPKPLLSSLATSTIPRPDDSITTAPPTWTKLDSAENVDKVKVDPEEEKLKKGVFFCNNQFYVLLRMIQILYERLHSCRTLAQQLASDPTQSYLANPVAVELGLYDSLGTQATRQIVSGPNPAVKFYDHLLQCCEHLFDGELDQPAFEDNLRYMFGTRAYLMFTVDKVIGNLVKQVQIVLSDVKTPDLMALLRRDRGLDIPSVQEQINQRRQAENIAGAEENLYRFDWSNDSKCMRIQLLDKNDGSVDDPRTMMQKWKQYTDSYVLSHQTEGAQIHVKPPLLQRTLDPSRNLTLTSTNFVSRGELRIKVALRTYRLFFVPDTEDYFFHRRSQEEMSLTAANAAEQRKEGKQRWEQQLEEKIAGAGHVTQV